MIDTVNAASPVGNPVAITVTDCEHAGVGVNPALGRCKSETPRISLLDSVDCCFDVQRVETFCVDNMVGMIEEQFQ